MWSFLVWLRAIEWLSVILQMIILLNLHKSLESQHIQINITYLVTAKQANREDFKRNKANRNGFKRNRIT